MKLLFYRSAIAILLATAAVKLISAGQDISLLSQKDPLLFFLTNRQVFIAAGTIELVVAMGLFFERNETFRSSMLAWLSTAFIGYRIGLKLNGYEGPCKCLGGVLDWFKIETDFATPLMTGIAVYLFVFSWIFFIKNMKSQPTFSGLNC